MLDLPGLENDMKSIIENLNQWGGNFLQFVWPMLWQSSLLIAFVFTLDLLLARRIRASVRYALWLVVLVKLLLPPTLALPTGAAWWLFQAKSAPAPATQPYTVTYSDAPAEPFVEPPSMPMPVLPPPKLDAPGWAMLATDVISAGLLLWLGIRWWQVTRTVRRAVATDEFSPMLAEASGLAGRRVLVRLKIVEGTMSPAVCGLFRPVILLPRALAERLSPSQLRVVLLHEIFHLCRGDVWVNCAQALLQIVYWWHPLLWVANARIRRVREEAVDDAVMLALREEADGYAPTLLEVAKLAFRRPLLSLGLVGIMESRSALRQRIERLVDFRAPRRAGLTLASLCGVFVFSAVALPMGESPAPVPVEQQPAQELVATNLPAEAEISVTLRVDPDIFTKNIQAQAAKSMISPTNDCGIILLDILRNEGVNTVPPHGIAFNTRDGEITVQNTAAQLDIVRQVVEQLNQADGKCELPLRHSSFHRPSVLVEASIYQLSAAESEKIISGLAPGPFGRGDGACWMASLEQFKRLTNQMAASGYKPVQRPRIQTSSGMPAQFFVGTDRYGTELDCKPYVDDGVIDLLLQGRVESDPAAGAAVTNRFNIRAVVENHGGVVVRMENAGGHAESNLVICIGVQILTNQPAHFQQRLQAIINRADGTKTEIRGDGGAKLLSQDDNLLFSRVFKIDTNAFLKNLQVKVPSFDWRGTTNLFHATSFGVRFVITNAGVDLNSPPGKALFFNEHDSLLYVKATEADLQVITPLITNLSPAPAGLFRERLQTIINRPPMTNGPAELTYTPQHQKIITQLKATRLAQFGPFDGETLEQVVKHLSEAVRQANTNSKGISFLIAGPNRSQVNLIDPSTGLPVDQSGPPVDARITLINLNATMENQTLMDILDKVVMTAVPPVKYSVADYGVIFSPRDQGEGMELFTRTYRADIQAFIFTLNTKGTNLSEKTSSSKEISAAARKYFGNLGVDWELPVGKSIFFNDRSGILFVRATKADLDTVDRVLQTLNQVVPQIHIKAQFVQVPKGAFKIPSDAVVKPFTGIINGTNTKAVFRALQSIKGFEVLAEPEVVTLSGWQAQVRVTQVVTVVTNFTILENSTNDSTSIAPQMSKAESGPVLDMVPYLLSDGYTINLSVIPTLTQFVGYDSSTNTMVAYTKTGQRIDIPIIRPIFHTEQVLTTANLWDGQTLLIGGMTTTNSVSSKVPMLGAIPLMGRLFQSKRTTSSDIFVFVTPTLIDSSGNRVHKADELPFAQTEIPPQPTAK